MKGHLPIVLLLACAAAFLFGVVQLFKLRFEVGDVYPAYSSLRADPLGTMAFYESLEKLPGLSVRRDHRAANQLPEGKDTTYLHLAARTLEWDWLPEATWEEIDSFLLNGGRLAITFHPETSPPFRPFSAPVPTGNPPARPRGGKDKSQPAQERPHDADSLRQRWGVEFEYRKLEVGGKKSYAPVEVDNRSQLPLPDSLAWHSATIFTNLDPSWGAIYARGTNPVVIERRFGKGSVVMATDSYFLSNEALREDRHADLLAWFVGPSRRVVFDEAHHGILDTAGVAALIRAYRLHGLAASLLVLAALFIWKNSVSLVPPRANGKSAGHVAGKDAAAGFVNLLRRNIPARDVLPVCFAEWTKSLYQGRFYTITAVTQAQAVMETELKRPQRERDAVRAYRAICRALKRPGPGPSTPTNHQQPAGPATDSQA